MDRLYNSPIVTEQAPEFKPRHWSPRALVLAPPQVMLLPFPLRFLVALKVKFPSFVELGELNGTYISHCNDCIRQ